MHLNTLRQGGHDKQSQLGAQENGCKLAKTLTNDDTCTALAAPLPLCTLVFEVIDRGNSKWQQLELVLVLHPWEATETQSLHILYEYAQLCTPTSRSCILVLLGNHPFSRHFKKGNLFRPNPGSLLPTVMTGILAHGVRIIPPSASRRPFIQLPEELLRIIFEEAKMDRFQFNWRKTLLSFALVCRAWSPASDCMYEEFSQYNAGPAPPNAPRLAKTLELIPDLGKKIRLFDSSHFQRVQQESEAAYLQRAKAIVTILQTATRTKNLTIFDTHKTLAQDFVRALCSSSEVRQLFINHRGLMWRSPGYLYILSVNDILRCISHWPHVQELRIHRFSPAIGLDNVPTPACSIKLVLLKHGSLELPQLRSLTTSWRSALQVATLQHISGLTNEDIRFWLSEVGPTLTALSIEFSPLRRKSNNEPYAVDMAMPTMVNLRELVLEGDIVSELALMRYVVPNLEQPELLWTRRYGFALSIENAPGVNSHGFLAALKTTAWTSISMRTHVLREENKELSREAQMIAKTRNILLVMQ